MRAMEARRRWSVAVSGVAAVLWPAVAAADPGCPSAFASWNCFVITLFFLSFIALPLGFLGGGVIAAVALKKKSTKKQWVIWGLSALSVPAAFMSTLVATTLLEKLNAGMGLWFLASAVLQVVYVAVALRVVLHRAKMPA